MRTYKAFLQNEILILKYNWFYIPLFFLLSIGFVIAPYFNKFNFSGIHYTQDMAGIIAFAGMILGVELFSGIFTLCSTSFEKTNNLNFFLFSRNINKVQYLLAKLTLPIVLSIAGIIIPGIIYYCMNIYSKTVNLIYTIILILFFSIIWTLLTVLFSQMFNRSSDIALVSLFGITLLIAGIIYIANPLVYPILISLILLFVLTCTLFILVFIVLHKQETSIDLERL